MERTEFPSWFCLLDEHFSSIVDDKVHEFVKALKSFFSSVQQSATGLNEQ